MKTFLEHSSELNIEKENNIGISFFDLIFNNLQKSGLDIQRVDTNITGLDDDNIMVYKFNPYWTGYFPDIRKMLDQIDSVLKHLNSYPDMIIMNYHFDKESLVIKVIWDNFIKTNIYKSLLTNNKFNL